LAEWLRQDEIQCFLVGSGPKPSLAQQEECARVGARLAWTEDPLDWLAADEADLAAVPTHLHQLASDWRADLVHLNLPSQAAGFPKGLPVVVASHSCVATWWAAVRGGDLPPEWRWQRSRNRQGFERADIILVPSRSHGEALRQVYGPLDALRVVHNATTLPDQEDQPKSPMVLSAGRWWDDGKNGKTLDQAAALSPWPVVMVGPLRGPNGQAIVIKHADAPGEVSAEAVVSMMDQAAIFASPSRYEPFGLAVLEAAARGAALILSDIPTFRELWDGAAMFVPAEDPRDWATAIQTLADSQADLLELADKARQRAKHYTSQRQRQGILQAYGEAMQQCAVSEMVVT
jgi:glycosyltransferase involved in cell wall biosynthesis